MNVEFLRGGGDGFPTLPPESPVAPAVASAGMIVAFLVWIDTPTVTTGHKSTVCGVGRTEEECWEDALEDYYSRNGTHVVSKRWVQGKCVAARIPLSSDNPVLVKARRDDLRRLGSGAQLLKVDFRAGEGAAA